MNNKTHTVTTFDELEDEARLLPDLTRELVISPRNALEQHFFNVADKHGIDPFADDYFDQDY